MKKTFRRFLVIIGIFAAMAVISKPLSAESAYAGQVIYFDLSGCTACDAVSDSGLFDDLAAANIEVIILRLDKTEERAVALQYARAYDANLIAPTILAGEMVYVGPGAIDDAYQNGDIFVHALDPLRDPVDVGEPLSFWLYLLLMIVGGLLDGINPCAIAMLLMFISIVGFTKERRTLVIVGLSYIGAIFVTYFAIGLAFIGLLGFSREAFPAISTYLYFGFMTFCFILFALSVYDFIMTRRQKYDKIKSQLPKFVQRFNKRVMERFTETIESQRTGLGKVIALVVIPVIIGIVVAITEAACTGPIYFGVLAMLEAQGASATLTVIEIFYILVFNIMFLVPLLIIMGIAVKAKSVAGIGNFVRRHISTIKIITAIFFLLMAVYFLLLALGVPWINFDYDFLSDLV